MWEIIILGVLICVSSGINCFFLISIRKSLIKNKIKMTQHNNAIKSLQEQTKSQEAKLETIITLLHDLEMESYFSKKNNDNIEHQYDRAKRILKNNELRGDDLLQSCDMTAEEIELLSCLRSNS